MTLILFDHGTPRGLARALSGHVVITAKARGWDRLKNGELLNAAEAASVELLLTTDRGQPLEQTIAKSVALDILDDDLVVRARRMATVYTAIAAFENSVREFVSKRLLESKGANWWVECVSEKIRNKAES